MQYVASPACSVAAQEVLNFLKNHVPSGQFATKDMQLAS